MEGCEMSEVDFSKMSFNPLGNIKPQLSADFSAIIRNSARQNMEVFSAMEEAREERLAQEKEKREALIRIADNSENTVSSLKETNDLLRENNDLLRKENSYLSSTLDEMNNVLKSLFEFEKEIGNDNNDLLRQATALAVQIDMSINENGKLNWKELLANYTSSAIFMGIQVFLHNKGLL